MWFKNCKHVASALAVTLSFVAVAGAQAQAEPSPGVIPSVALPADLDRVLRDYERAWIAKDTQALAALFTTDGMALPNGRPPASGAAQIAKAYSLGAGSPLSLRGLAYEVSGDLAYVVGGFAEGPGKPDIGKFVLVLRRATDGRWRIAADIDNANAMPRRAPPQPQPGATESAPGSASWR